jgi:hypothetical protein
MGAGKSDNLRLLDRLCLQEVRRIAVSLERYEIENDVGAEGRSARLKAIIAE